MSECVTTAPATLDDFLRLIDNCATEVGGAGWQALALTGVLVLVAAGFAPLLLVGLVRR